MSWIKSVQTELVITTGDGKQFTPLWKPTTKTIEYNIAEFEFPDQQGTLVRRGTPKGSKYNLEIYFQGEDCIEQAQSFEVSANDNRLWVISHPYHKSISVQPTGLSFDYTKYNVVSVTGTIIETITEDSPKITIDPIDKIKQDKETLDETFTNAFDVTPNSTDINTLTTNNERIYTEGAKSVRTTIEAEEYFNLFNKANAAILNATSEPLAALRAIQAVISYPSLFTIGVINRINSFTNQFNLLRTNIDSIVHRSEKKIYENNAGTIISSQLLTSATPLSGDYGNKNDVLSVIEVLLENYDTYLADLDSLQSDNGGDDDSYIPDAGSLLALNYLINFTVSNLFNIALNSRQERTLFSEDDTNIILLAHRFYGLTADDSTIDELIKNNNIGLNEMLQIRKGRKIVYYI